MPTLYEYIINGEIIRAIDKSSANRIYQYRQHLKNL